MKDSFVDEEKTCSQTSSTSSDKSIESLGIKTSSSSDSMNCITPFSTPSTDQSTPFSSTQLRVRSRYKTPEQYSQDEKDNLLTSPAAMNKLPIFYWKGPRLRSKQRRSSKVRWNRKLKFDEKESMSCDADIDESSESTYDEYPSIHTHHDNVMFSGEWDEEVSVNISPTRGVQSYFQNDCSPLSFDGRFMNTSFSSLGLSTQDDLHEAQVSPGLIGRSERSWIHNDHPGGMRTGHRVLDPSSSIALDSQSSFADHFTFRLLQKPSSYSMRVFFRRVGGNVHHLLTSLRLFGRRGVNLKKIHLTKFSIFIIAYSVLMFLVLAYKVHNLSSMATSSHQYMLLRMYSEYTKGVPTKTGHEERDPNPASSSFDTSNSIGTSGTNVIIRRSLGGIQVYRSKVGVKKFGKVKRERRGLGALDVNMYANSNNYVRDRGQHPRLIDCFMGEASFIRPRRRRMDVDQTPFSDNTQLYGLRSSDDEALSKMEILEHSDDDECKNELWQTEYQPSCNGMHEVDLINVEDNENRGKLELFEKQGFWRNAWRLDMPSRNHLGEMDTMILKTPKYEHNFEHAYYEHDRVDAIAMSQLTFSPHVIDIYSFCGRTVLTEFADGPRLGTLADKAKKQRLRKLEIARDLASGLADVHYGQGEKVQMVHFDINPANIVVVNNTLKINDFNIAKMAKHNTTSGEMCFLLPHQYPNAQWRSPEEVNGVASLNERADVFSLGHILFRIICSHEPWNKLEFGGRPSSTELADKVKAGKLPRIPTWVLDSNDPEIEAIREAMFMCYNVDQKMRASSRQISTFLDNALKELRNSA